MLLQMAYGNRPRLVIPCRKANGTLTAAGSVYNQIHGFFRARAEHLFALLWTFALVRVPWRGREEIGCDKLFKRLKVLLNLVNFLLRRIWRYEPYGPWAHFPEVHQDDAESSEDNQDTATSSSADVRADLQNQTQDQDQNQDEDNQDDEAEEDNDFTEVFENLPRLTRRQRQEIGL